MLGFLPLPHLPFQSLKYVTFMHQEDMSSWMVLHFSLFFSEVLFPPV